MTRIKYRIKPVWHETHSTRSGREILVAEQPSNLLIRLKGTREVLDLPWSMLYVRAADLRAAANARNKRERRKVGAR